MYTREDITDVLATHRNGDDAKLSRPSCGCARMQGLLLELACAERQRKENLEDINESVSDKD